jgi:hypothetical protein
MRTKRKSRIEKLNEKCRQACRVVHSRQPRSRQYVENEAKHFTEPGYTFPRRDDRNHCGFLAYMYNRLDVLTTASHRTSICSGQQLSTEPTTKEAWGTWCLNEEQMPELLSVFHRNAICRVTSTKSKDYR